jgi:hypothetical protein
MKMMLEEQSATVWTGLNWIGIGSTDRLLWKSDELTDSVKEVKNGTLQVVGH